MLDGNYETLKQENGLKLWNTKNKKLDWNYEKLR